MKKIRLLIITVVCTLAMSSMLYLTAMGNQDKKDIETEHEISRLNDMGMTLVVSDINASISEDDAIKIASEYCPFYAETAKKVYAEYHNMTNPKFRYISKEAKEKNQRLEKEGYLNNTAVYIVTFHGIEKYGHDTFGGKDPTIFNEYNLVIDANSGEVLYGFSYR